MANGDRIYRRTPAGQSAWETREALPTPLRRVLSMVEVDTHAHVVCKRLRDHEEAHECAKLHESSLVHCNLLERWEIKRTTGGAAREQQDWVI